MRDKIIVFFIALVSLIVSYYDKEFVIIEEPIIESKETDILKDYLIGVVACEMPASFNYEALKAMSVAARTYTMYKLNKDSDYDIYNNNDQCYITVDDMKDKWDNQFNKYYNIIENAVNDTNNIYMTYKDEIIIPFYFSISNGYTENVENVFSQKLDYLVTVDSSFDSKYDYKSDLIKMSLKDFLDKLDIKNTSIIDIEVKRNKSNRVDYVYINDKKFKGTKFRTLLGLRSTDFNITIDNDIVKIETKGYGHGVGMSQYGANVLANKGYTYDEILKYYYTGINIEYN